MKKRTIVAIGVATAATAAFIAARRSGLREDLDWVAVDKPGRIIDVDGYGVHCVLQGAGPAVVLVHGFGGNVYSYRKLIPLLARDHRVVAVDLKGYGYSQRDGQAGVSHGDQVAMLKGLLDRLGIGRAAFVGHSMGGAVVQRFAATYPEMVDVLVLAASVTGDERIGQHLGRIAPPAFLLKPLIPVLAGLTSTRLLQLSFHDPSMLTDEVRDGYLRPIRIRGTLDGILRSIRESGRDAAIDRSRITMPVLLLYAAHDRAVPLDAAQRLRELLPQARLVVIARAAHLLLEERPEECARAIEDFLRDARTGAAVAPAAAT